jgi:ferredoxin-type protein NapH
MSKTRKVRQQTRKTLLLVSFLLFPIIMNYLSPYVIIDGASQGIVNGSLIVFAGMFVSSLFVGRLWCGWACPAGGLGEIAFAINDRPVGNGQRGKKIDWIKWAIWAPWLALIAWAAIAAGGYHSVNFTLDTVNGISVAGDADRPAIIAYIIYYLVVALFLVLPLLVGKRASCHTICWMAPFMILGRKLRNARFLGVWPALRLQADPGRCSDCLTCSTHCPMSLNVNGMVKLNAMENDECILCGSCVDGCARKAIRYSFSAGK